MFHQKQAAARPPKPDTTKWLWPEGPYLDYVTKLDTLYPGTGTIDPLNHHISSRVGQSRSVLLELTPDQKWSRQTFKDGAEIKNHFTDRQQNDVLGKTPVLSQRIYILEGLDPDFVQAYGSYFFMDPRFFVRQERNDLWNLNHNESVIHDTDILPSRIDPERYFRIKYREVRHFGPQLRDWRTVCAATGRHVAAIGFQWNLDNNAAVARKFSFWSRMGRDDSWDVVILCDPPVHQVHILSRPMVTDIFQNEPFQGGYPDFIKREDANPKTPQSLDAPPRTSLLDDICFYYENHYQSLINQPGSQAPLTPKVATVVPLKIICAHYLKLIDYFEVILTKLAKVEWQLSRQSDWEEYTGPAIEEQWSSLQLSSRRLSEFINDVECILRDLRIPIQASPPDLGTSTTTSLCRSDWQQSCDEDFRYIYHRLQSMKSKVDQLITSTMGLSNIVGSRQALSEARRSVKEAKSTKTLTVVGLVFIPLAYTCALFSMSDQFRPGAHLFWVYFAVSVPLVFVVFAGTFVIQLGYDEDAAWSFEKFKRACLQGLGKGKGKGRSG
ncbi:hypothetical protein DL95DRAFT_436331 [Leptodontidium sp. 2 PMI_412]|nr:hypothetical protein DL95DRAFT_436331 [Leptodontidium sp. 2 PMI_412]